METEQKGLIVGFVVITLFSLVSYCVFPSLWSTSFVTSTGVLLTNAQILATVFAITISLTLVGFEYFSQNLSPKIAKSVIESRYTIGLAILFVPAILVNIGISTIYHENVPQIALTISLIFLASCLFYLLAFISYVARTIQPQNQLKIFEESIPENFNEEIVAKVEDNVISGTDPEDYFVEIQHVIQNKIEQREIYQFGEWLNLLIDKEIDYLIEIREVKKDNEINPNNATAIVNYFLSFQKSIYSQLAGINDTRYIPAYSIQIANVLGLLIDIKSIAAMTTLSNQFKRIGRDIVSFNQETIFEQYFDHIEKITLKLLRSIPQTDYRVSTTEIIEQFVDGTSPEYMWVEGITGQFGNYVLFSREILTLAIDANFDGVAVTGSNFYVRLLETVLDREEDAKRIDLVQTITKAQRDVFEYAVKEDVLTSYYTMPGSYEMIAQSPKEVREYLVTEFCEACITAVKHDSYAGPHELGVAGRVLVKEHPELAEEIVDSLIQCLNIVRDQTDFEDIEEQTVVKELSSIKNWNDHNNQAINEAIDRALDS